MEGAELANYAHHVILMEPLSFNGSDDGHETPHADG